MNFNRIPVLVRRVQYWVGRPFGAITASTLLGRLSTRFRSVSMGMCDQSFRSAFVSSGTDVGWEGLARSLRSNLSQRCSIGLKLGLCADQSSSSTKNCSSMSLWTLLCALVHKDMDERVWTLVKHSHRHTSKPCGQPSQKSWSCYSCKGWANSILNTMN